MDALKASRNHRIVWINKFDGAPCLDNQREVVGCQVTSSERISFDAGSCGPSCGRNAVRLYTMLGCWDMDMLVVLLLMDKILKPARMMIYSLFYRVLTIPGGAVCQGVIKRDPFFWGGIKQCKFWGVNPLAVPCWVCEYNAPVCGSLLSLFLLVYPKSSFLTLSCPLSFFHPFFLSLFLIRYRSGPFYSTARRYHNVVLGRCFRYTFQNHTQKRPS